MAIETISNARDIRDAARIRKLEVAKNLDEYAGFTSSRFEDARRSEGILPLIIPARNEEKDLPSALFAAAQNPNIYPLVIDNQSSDDTAKIAIKMGAGVITVDHGNKMAATQEGLRAAQQELGTNAIFYTDADTLIPRRWGDAMHAKLLRNDRGKGVAVFGHSFLWDGSSRRTDTILSAAKTARAAKSALKGHVVARGHNYALLLDDEGRMNEAIMDLDPHMFNGDDYTIRNVLRDTGANVISTMSLPTTVVTRNDRVSSLTDRISSNYGNQRDAEYNAHYSLH